MRVGVALLVAVGACAPKPAEPLVTPSPRARAAGGWRRPAPPPTAAAPRPALDLSHLVPDFHDELRWPLSAMSHPSFEPRFDVAAVFADPGIGWLELCKRGVHKRVTAGRNRDELQYLRGWCSALAGDIDRACAQLAPLGSSPVLGIPAAIRIDVANILASSGDADKAEHWIAEHDIRDVELLDTLAATYVELGREHDAYLINRRAIDSDVRATAATTCLRLVKQIVLGPAGERALPGKQLENLATKPRVPAPACTRLHDALKCWSDPATACGTYLAEQKQDIGYAQVLRAYYNWPAVPATEARWLGIVDDVKYASRLPEGLELAITALEAAGRAIDRCRPGVEARRATLQRLMKQMQLSEPPRLVALGRGC